jgi:translation initiation factor IF-2
MNVTELARRLQMPTRELLEQMPRLGFSVGRRAIKVDDRLVERITEAITKDKQRRDQAAAASGVREVGLGEQTRQAESRRSLPLPLPPAIAVRDFAATLGLPVAKVIGELMRNGVMASINERIDYETAAIIAEDLGFKPTPASAEATASLAAASSPEGSKRMTNEDEPVRPPVVVVMGHVDHGKTTLLDALRHANVAASEHGHITQRLGAYQVSINGRSITFLDTPGHEAFASMRTRGGRAADVAVLVVAADDGVQPQTIEALQIIQSEKLPFVVAINKVDKADANIDRTKQQLAELNVATEDYGGKAVAVPVSAKAGTGLQELLETVLLVSDLQPPRAPVDVPAEGLIIEAHLDRGEGPVATVVVQRGTLRPGDWVVIGDVVGRVRQLKDEYGQVMPVAGPSQPAKILGLKSLPKAGDVLTVTSDKKVVQSMLKASRRAAGSGASAPVAQKQAPKQQEGAEQEAAKPELLLVVKADTLGSLEALLEIFTRFSSVMVGLKVVKSGLGYVNDADILAAQSTGATVVAYHTELNSSAKALAHERQIGVLQNAIIYKLLEELEVRLGELIAPEVIRRQLGTVQVLALFKAQGRDQVVGGRITAGTAKAETKVKLMRNGTAISYGDLVTLQSGKQVVAEAAVGSEAGFSLKLGTPVVVGDTLEVFQEEVNRRQLDSHLR